MFFLRLFCVSLPLLSQLVIAQVRLCATVFGVAYEPLSRAMAMV